MFEQKYLITNQSFDIPANNKKKKGHATSSCTAFYLVILFFYFTATFLVAPSTFKIYKPVFKFLELKVPIVFSD